MDSEAPHIHPQCYMLQELPEAVPEREKLWSMLDSAPDSFELDTLSPLERHLLAGLAYTTGSAVGSTPPSDETCRTAFIAPNHVGLSAGARAWSKHAPRSSSEEKGWWGSPRGPVSKINEDALQLFSKVVGNATWRNLHQLPHDVFVFELRVKEGYGMRWSQDRSSGSPPEQPWIFRGFVEPMMENGHEVGWRH